MASNYTSNYGLCQWAATDKVLRTEFNADNSKIDAAIKAVDSRLTSVANSKADQTALTSMSQTVSGALELRNCRFVTGSYTGTGAYGASNANTLTFTQKPVFVCITSDGTGMQLNLTAGQNSTLISSSGVSALTVTWGSKSVSWYVQDPSTPSSAPAHQMNTNSLYHYFAILEIA